MKKKGKKGKNEIQVREQAPHHKKKKICWYILMYHDTRYTLYLKRDHRKNLGIFFLALQKTKTKCKKEKNNKIKSKKQKFKKQNVSYKCSTR